VSNFDPNVKPKIVVKNPVKDFKATENSERWCVYRWPWQWERCIHCNNIRKYMQWKDCPMYKE
jgi:hypothetical protein